MKAKTKQILTNMATRLQFYLESIRFLTPIRALTEDQLRGTNNHGSKKRNRN